MALEDELRDKVLADQMRAAAEAYNAAQRACEDAGLTVCNSVTWRGERWFLDRPSVRRVSETSL